MKFCIKIFVAIALDATEAGQQDRVFLRSDTQAPVGSVLTFFFFFSHSLYYELYPKSQYEKPWNLVGKESKLYSRNNRDGNESLNQDDIF